MGEVPPFRAPVFVVTHRDRGMLGRQGGTSFTFVTGGIERAVGLAKDAVGGKDVAVAGGGTLLRQVLAAGLLDELELHIVPVLLGDGMRLFDAGLGLDVREGIELTPARVPGTPEVTHIRYVIGPRAEARARRSRRRRLTGTAHHRRVGSARRADGASPAPGRRQAAHAGAFLLRHVRSQARRALGLPGTGGQVAQSGLGRCPCQVLAQATTPRPALCRSLAQNGGSVCGVSYPPGGSRVQRDGKMRACGTRTSPCRDLRPYPGLPPRRSMRS